MGRKTISGEWLLLIIYNICEFQSVSAKSRSKTGRWALTALFMGELAFEKQISAVMIEPGFFQDIRSFLRKEKFCGEHAFPQHLTTKNQTYQTYHLDWILIYILNDARHANVWQKTILSHFLLSNLWSVIRLKFSTVKSVIREQPKCSFLKRLSKPKLFWSGELSVWI